MRKTLCFFFFAFTASVLFLMSTPFANFAARGLVVEPEVKKADIIVILGGGAYKNGVLSGASNERLIHGLLLYRQGLAPEIFLSGGSISAVSKKLFHTLSKSEDAAAIDAPEASVMRDISIGLAVPPEHIRVDERSTNTYTNLRAAGSFMRERGFKKCLLVTSPTHMSRAIAVAEKLGVDCSPAPVEDYTRFRTGAFDRLSLAGEVFWEYAALALYKAYGYI
ncbi:MAG: YdcF family protein [Deltaproteobacteria bacterium]|nr:YdcF family protein [Deltaproteobacteria bacterium]